MFITEAEAQRRWCPFGRQPIYVGSQVVPINRQPNGDVPSCLGSLCMAWRWAETRRLKEIDPTTDEVTMDEQPRTGYCGAFGKPDYGE